MVVLGNLASLTVKTQRLAYIQTDSGQVDVTNLNDAVIENHIYIFFVNFTFWKSIYRRLNILNHEMMLLMF